MVYKENRWLKGWDGQRTRALALSALLAGASVWGANRAEQRFTGDGVAPQAALLAAPAVAAAPAVTTAAGWDLPNIDHPRVDYWVNAFTTRKRGEFERYLSRSGRYSAMISTKLRERGMPQDLVYLAMIESGFSPKAYSPAAASGLWQFIAETGRRYGLEINQAVDERNDPEKSTDAALTYLQELHERFGSWYLAAAAYNTGENRVARIMREETGSERGNERSYLRIRHRLPRETREYVPLMVAAARISKERERYGFDDVEFESPLRYAEVEVEPGSALPNIAKAAGTTVAELKRLNPQLKLNRTRNDERSTVRIPAEGAQTFAASWARVRTERLASAEPARKSTTVRKASTARKKSTTKARSYRVRSGDSLWEIARRNGTSVTALKRTNGLRGNRLRPGQTLRIPA